MDIEFRERNLSTLEQDVVALGFIAHSEEQHTPQYNKERVSCLVRDGRGDIAAVLTADTLWDWIYIDEFWVSSERRGYREFTRFPDFPRGYLRIGYRKSLN